MTPQDQEFLHDPKAGVIGDCARAVIASLLDLPIATVPNFAQLANNDVLGFYGLVEKFLEEHGYGMQWHRNPIYFLKPGIDTYHYMSGRSPRGKDGWHAVVGLNGKPFFDPHPSRAGLAGAQREWRHSFLSPIKKEST
jgi:hypothetical protein